MRQRIASDKQRELPLEIGDETLSGLVKEDTPVIGEQLMAGSYQPQAVRRVNIPKADGGQRQLGIKSQRVLDSITRYLSRHLKLPVNKRKSAVDRPWRRSFLGFTFTRNCKAKRRKVSEGSLKRFKQTIRRLTRRTRGRTIEHIVADLRNYIRGWKSYFGINEVPSPLRDLEKWMRRKLRCYVWKQWGRSGYRKLRQRGVSRDLAWNTCKSAHGPWRLSQSPALVIALPLRYFSELGLPNLVDHQ
jgi:RNA-directed DNA polymerase